MTHGCRLEGNEACAQARWPPDGAETFEDMETPGTVIRPLFLLDTARLGEAGEGQRELSILAELDPGCIRTRRRSSQ